MKRCTRCGADKPLEQFAKQAAARGGTRAICRACNKVLSAAYYRQNREAVLARNAVWAAANTERVAATQAAWDANHKEQRARTNAVWYALNTARAMATVAARNKAHRALVDAAKSGPCVACGDSYPPACMDLHHRDPATKCGEVSNLIRNRTETLLAEIDKCDLLCAICHRLLHSQP